MTIDETQIPKQSPSPIDDNAPWPKWRVRLSRLSPYTMDIEEQLERLYQLTIMLTIVPGVMAGIILTIFTLFGRPDVGAIAVTLIFGPMIGLAWRDYRRINRQARLFLASQTGE